MKLRLYYDQVKAVQDNFFPYLSMLCETKIRDAGKDEEQIFNCRAVQSLFSEVESKFMHKILHGAVRPTLTFTFAQGLTFYQLLIKVPLQSNSVYLVNLRDLITNTLLQQMKES